MTILISPNWELEFHVHIDAFQLAIGAIFAQNPTDKFDQLVMYAFRLLNSTKRNYSTIEIEALAIVFALHKFKHYLLGNQFVVYVDHMAFVHLVNKP
jgi:branched-subunit amino acid transport protein AzlD